MRYLLDTDICIEMIRQRAPQAVERLKNLSPEEVAISSITVAELQYGAQKSQRVQRNQERLDLFLIPLPILDFDFDAAVAYGSVRQQLEASGHMIGPYDTLLAAQAISRNLVLVTNNRQEFERVTGLQVENWLS